MVRVAAGVLLSFIVLCTSCQFASAQNPESKAGAWYEFAFKVKLADKWTYQTDISIRNYQIVDEYNQLLFRNGIFFKITDNVNVGLGHGFLNTHPFMLDEDTLIQNQNWLWQHIGLKQKVGILSISHRYRLEERWIKQHTTENYLTRFRYMLSLKIPFLKKDSKYPYLVVADELMINIADNPFEQNRIYAGLGYQISKGSSVQIGYMDLLFVDTHFHRLMLKLVYAINPRKKVWK